MEDKTQFRTKRIGIVSKRKNVSDFFRMEAESVGCFVKAMTDIPEDILEYDMIIADIDTDLSDTDPDDNRIYKIVPDTEADIDQRTLSYPISVKRLRGLYMGHIAMALDAKEERTLHIGLSLGEGNTVFCHNKRIILTDGEQRVLKRLGETVGEPVSREELRELFGAEDGNITDVYICRLRKKLEEPFGARLIKTVRGRGYLLLAQMKNMNIKGVENDKSFSME